MTGTYIVNGDTLLGNDSLQCCYVSACQVNNVDIVAYASTVVCVVVVTEYAQFSTLAYGCLCDVGHQVVGDTVGILADGTALVSTDGVEVAEQNDVPFVVGLLYVHQNLLKHRLGLSVGVGAMALGALLGDGDDSGITVNGSAGRENHVLATVLAHYVNQNESTVHVVLIVLQRLCAALANSLETGKVDTCVELVLVEYLLQTFAVADVHLVEGNLLADNLCNALQRDRRRVVQIVNNYCLVTSLGQFNQGVASDKACTAS